MNSVALDGRLGILKAKLKYLKKIKDEYDFALNKKERLTTFLGQLELISEELYLLNTSCIQEEYEYRRQRIEYLSYFVSEELASIFPNENFTVEIRDYMERGKLNLVLLLHDDSGNEHMPNIQEGKLCQELISFSCAFGIIHAASLNKMYIDEAFAAASPSNLAKLMNNLKKILDNGVQVFCIEQSDEIYKNISRREFFLEKNEFSGTTELIYSKDVSGI